MWGTDATRFYTEREGWCWFFGAVDHYTTEVMGWHVAKIGDRWAALEPIRQGMTTAFGSIAPKVALGVGPAPRLGEPVHREHLRQRDQVLGVHRHAGVRWGT
jgi:hypothetical protein